MEIEVRPWRVLGNGMAFDLCEKGLGSYEEARHWQQDQGW